MSFWDKQEQITVLPKNKTEDIMISHCTKNDKEYIDIRIYKQTYGSTTKTLTKNGVAIPMETFLNEMPKIIEQFKK